MTVAQVAARPGPVGAGFAFVALMASLGALNAFATDIVIPALGRIDRDFDLGDPNRRQWVLFAFFLGMAVSQLILGPVADRYGRRMAVFIGLGVYMAGAVWSGVSGTFEGLLAGRVLQGMGSGGMRVLSMAIVRDRSSGDEMARILSLTNTVFVAMVLIAPFAGQWMMDLGGWRWVFVWLAVQGALTGVWFALAQAETLRPEHRRPLRLGPVARTLVEVLATVETRRSMFTLGLCFGAFVAYLSTAQQVLGELYGLGSLLPWAFGAVSIVFGLMSLANAAAVRRFGAARLTQAGLAWWAVLGLSGAAAAAVLYDGAPPFWMYLTWSAVTVSGFAFIFGNVQALGLAPMGDRAGAASSAMSACGTVCGVVAGGLVGAAFDGTVLPQALSFGVAGLLGLIIMRKAAA
ncbi:MAG: MFS transporter [Pseudomonadota bacterium]